VILSSPGGQDTDMSLLDPNWKYTPSFATDIRKTFEKARRQLAKEQRGPTPVRLQLIRGSATSTVLPISERRIAPRKKIEPSTPSKASSNGRVPDLPTENAVTQRLSSIPQTMVLGSV
jgi:hypothetical protein